MFKMKPKNLLFLLFSVGFIIFRCVEGYKESKDWKATYSRDGEMRVINSSNAAQIFDDFKEYYLAQKNIDENKIFLDFIDRVKKIIIDNHVSIHELLRELKKLDEVLNNPFLTNEGREKFNNLREIIVDPLNEYGKENPAFLETFNEAEIAMRDYRKIQLDPDIANLQRVIVEEGFEKVCIVAKKLSQTDEGRTKLQRIFGDSTMDGCTFLELLDKISL